ncbi:MAG: MotA/TolQ/ExbB proton channel family protein [candidate division WOR-3 bacterium]|uniref:MotA/TolQ/ExbB proton channel family protein n=1 Tax=candidate division WOR-3 bacterium TaxID=2052148 RepID=A0A7C4VYA1_UNCW3
MILGQSLYQIFKSSFVMILLLLLSIIVLALIIERLIYFYRNKFKGKETFEKFANYLKKGDVEGAKEYALNLKNPLGRLLLLGLENLHLKSEELKELFIGQIIEEKVKYENYLGGIGTIANGATLLGLLGTVIGLIKAFHNIAITGSGGPVVVSKGIAEALLTTAFGLLIGIPALFFYNYFSKKANDLSEELESLSQKFLVLLDPIRNKKEKIKEEKEVETFWKF